MILRLTRTVYQEISRPMQPVQVNLGWARVSLLPSRPYSTREVPRHTVLGFAFERQSGVHAIGGKRREDFDAWPGELAITQPGTEIFSESADGGEYLTVHLDPTADTGSLLCPGDVPRTVISGRPPLFRMGVALRRLMFSPHTDNLAIEEAVTCLLGVAQRATRRQLPPLPLVRNQQIASVLDYIDAHLSESLRLQELALVAGLSRLQFLRCFARTVGLTPHAFITERRLQRARKQLGESNLAPAAIAADCGFAHQSHLGSLLRREIGLTPAQYRSATI